MNDPLTAHVEVLPFEVGDLVESRSGRALLNALEILISDYGCDAPEDNDGTFRFNFEGVSDGAATFSRRFLPDLAWAAGVWYRHGDSGRCGRWPWMETFAPNGRRLAVCTGTSLGYSMLVDDRWVTMREAGGDIDERVDAFFKLATMPLLGWAQCDIRGALDDLLDLAVVPAAFCANESTDILGIAQ